MASALLPLAVGPSTATTGRISDTEASEGSEPPTEKHVSREDDREEEKPGLLTPRGHGVSGPAELVPRRRRAEPHWGCSL